MLLQTERFRVRISYARLYPYYLGDQDIDGSEYSHKIYKYKVKDAIELTFSGRGSSKY
jgi:hypothetical protein